MEQKYEYLYLIDINMVKDRLVKREETGHKGTFGTMFSLCGSVGMTGAMIMSTMSALRCGVGMVKCAVPNSIYNTVSHVLFEPIFVNLPENDEGTISYGSLDLILKNLNKCTAILLGCGLGRNTDVANVVFKVIEKTDLPIVIDADGINAISKNINILERVKNRAVITPHIGEMSRLLGISIDEVISNKFRCASKLSKKYQVITVLKGSETIICDKEGRIFVNRVANSGMAKGGSGDVLAGMIASFLAQGITPLDSAICGVYLHSMAGLLCKEKYSKVSMLPTDVIKELPNVFLNIESGG